MIGGPAEVVQRLDPILAALVPGTGTALPTEGREARDARPAQGYVHCGPNGAGHYAKMVHNGIEYGMMQAMAEGLDLMRAAPFELDLPDITEAWRRGSVVSSWLLDLTAQALAYDPDLAEYSGHVSDSGEGRWTVDTAVEQAVPVPVLAAALFARFRSRQEASFADKALSAMRKGFGGHLEPKVRDAS
jgi:6-phosphogluconate dehydrogenase